MYKLYIDRPETFRAKVLIEGTSDQNAHCRIILESNGVNMLFPGSINNNECTIEMNKIKQFISEGATGTLRLEVIADDMFFTPWESQFNAQVSRKVTAEIYTPDSVKDTPQVVITEVQLKNSPKQTYVGQKEFIQLLETKFLEEDINIYNVKKNHSKIKKIVEVIFKSKSLIIDESLANNVVALTTKALTNIEKNK